MNAITIPRSVRSNMFIHCLYKHAMYVSCHCWVGMFKTHPSISIENWIWAFHIKLASYTQDAYQDGTQFLKSLNDWLSLCACYYWQLTQLYIPIPQKLFFLCAAKCRLWLAEWLRMFELPERIYPPNQIWVQWHLWACWNDHKLTIMLFSIWGRVCLVTHLSNSELLYQI